MANPPQRTDVLPPAADYKWSWWRRFMSRWKLFLYMDYSIRAKRQMSNVKRGERELKILRQFVDPLRASIDVGANKGVYTYWLEKYSKKVYAYEANQALVYSFLREPRGNVEVRPFGISNVTGDLKFRIPVAGVKQAPDPGQKTYLEHQGGNLRSDSEAVFQEQRIRAYRLDDLKHEPVGFIKIDVEGHEMEVIEGAGSLIRRENPVLMVEFVQAFYERPVLELVGEVESLGYQAQVLTPAGLKGPRDIDQAYFQDGHPHCIKNFFFVPVKRGPTT